MATKPGLNINNNLAADREWEGEILAGAKIMDEATATEDLLQERMLVAFMIIVCVCVNCFLSVAFTACGHFLEFN